MKKLQKIKLLLPIVFFTFLLALSCNQKKEIQSGYEITGELTGFPEGTELYLNNLSTQAVFDTAVLKDGKFKFLGELDAEPEQIWLTATIDKKFYYTNLLVGNESIKIKADIKDFPWNVKVSGSKTHNDHSKLQTLLKDNYVKRDSMVQEYLRLSPSEQEQKGTSIWKGIGKIDSTTDKVRFDYIKSNLNSYTSIIHLGYLRNSLPKDTISKIFNSYSPEIKQSKYAKVIKVFLKEPAVEVGQPYRDFDATNQEDVEVKLSEIKGKYTLIDFTSANCGPCIEAAYELQQVNTDFSEKLKLISFSVDPSKKLWLKSLARDNVNWTSLWDGNGPYSETAIKYGVQAFPTFILIGPDDQIIDKWVGYEKGMIAKRLQQKMVQ